MTIFTMMIDMNNAAFEDDHAGTELAKILREVADDADGRDEDMIVGGNLRDSNGNTVGLVIFERRPYEVDK
jgi:hypothetical protein